MSLEQLSERYREHNLSERGRGFVFGGQERIDLFKRYVGGPGRRVLDLGCRDGALTREFLDGNDVVGVDADRDALAQAAELGIETHWADVEQPLPFADASFDVVVAGELLEHVRDPEGLLGEVRRLLRPGGTFVGSVPNSFRLYNRLRFLLGLQPEWDPTHLHMFSVAQVRQLLKGFDAPHVHLISSRFLRLQPRLFANDIVFSGRKAR